MAKPKTYNELWNLYDEAIQALRTLASVTGDAAAADLEDLAKKSNVEIGTYSDQIDLERIFKAIRKADTAINKRNEMSRL